MSRAGDRLLGRARARWRRVATVVRAALSSDVAHRDRRAADCAEAEELVRTAGRLRGGLAKVAQLRAYLELEDGLGLEARAQLAALWDRVPPDPPQAIRQVVEMDLGAPISALFAAWQDDPIAAASLGQVHAARLFDGTEVAVKVQYPGIAAALADDLASPSVLRQLIGPGLGAGAEQAALDTLRAAITRELDYVAERVALGAFARAFFGDASIVIPRAIEDRSSTRVLTMTRLPGLPLRAFGHEAGEDERAAVAATLFRFALGAPLRHGLVNGDPHPGNYLVRPGDGGRAGFVDFGFVIELGAFTAIDRRLFLAMVHRDGEALRYAAYEEGLVPRVGVFDQAGWREFERSFAGPFLVRGARRFGPTAAAQSVSAFGRLVRSGAVRLAPEAVVLWRQRIGFLNVLGSLDAVIDLRRLLCEVLDDDRHPTPLYERYP